MSDQPILDARLAREAQFLADKFGGRAVTVSFVINDVRGNYWRAEILPTDETTARRLGIPWLDLTEVQVAMCEFMAIAVGEGATRGEAIKNLQPVKWEFPNDHQGTTPLGEQ